MHEDAWALRGCASLATPPAEEVILQDARVVGQPGDGDCLFHSLAFYDAAGRSAKQLRGAIADFISRHPELQIGGPQGNAIRTWISYDAGTAVGPYVQAIRQERWGGGIELAVYAAMQQAQVRVFEAQVAPGGAGQQHHNTTTNTNSAARSQHKCVGTFGPAGGQAPTTQVNVLYIGRNHYDVICPSH